MGNQNQNNDDFPEGFLIKDSQGKFKKVHDDKVTDFSVPPSAEPPATTAPQKQAVEKASPAPPPPPKAPVTKPKPVDFPKSPPPPISSSSKAAFLMEPEDEEEIQKHKEELEKIKVTSAVDQSALLSSTITNIMQQQGLKFEDEILEKRFLKVSESRLRNIRTSIETEEVFVRPRKVGGLEMQPEMAKKVVAALEEEARKFSGEETIKKMAEAGKKETLAQPPEIKQAVEEKIESTLAPPPPAFIPKPKMPVQEKEKIEEEKEKIPEKKVEEQPKPTVSSEPPIKPTPVQKPVPEVEEKPAEKISPSLTSELYRQSQKGDMAKIAKARKPEPQRPQVVDIRQPAQVIGPVEELGEIDLKEFRRLGSNPKEAAEKVLEKVYLLEEESWQLRMDGVKAWQHSPVHQLYVDIGRESIESNITVDKVISQRAQEQKPYLLLEEWLAINGLNSKLII